jgi:predicted dehydrogenase
MPVAKTNRVNFGVIGAGGIAFRKTIPGMLKARNCRLVAVMDPVGVERVAAAFGGPKAYRNEADLLADPQVDAVYIASPVHCHAHEIIMAAEAGKHILCEKPLCLNLRQAKEAVAACREHKVLLQEGYMMKFHGAHAKIKELIDAGRLGKIVSMRAQLSCWYPRIEGAWRQDPKLGGGGALIDMATHLYDLLEYFAGPIRRVAALVGTLVQDYRSDDASTTLLEFKSGAHATIDCFYCIPDEASRTRLEVYGSQGAILTEGTIGQSKGGKMEGIFGLGAADYDAAQDKDVVRHFERIPFPAINPYTAECEYFADCILRGRRPAINNAQNALHILSITENAYASARSRKMMSV